MLSYKYDIKNGQSQMLEEEKYLIGS